MTTNTPLTDRHLASTQKTLDELYKRGNQLSQEIEIREKELDDIERVIRALEPAQRRLKFAQASTLDFSLDETFETEETGKFLGTKVTEKLEPPVVKDDAA